MRKRGIRIGVVSIAFFVIFLVVPSGTKAETRDRARKDFLSVLHLESSRLLGPKAITGAGKDRGSNPLRTFLVPMKHGLYAFLDVSSPSHRGLKPKDSPTDYRAVVGFHFPLR